MNVKTIETPVAIAREKYREYREAVKKYNLAEDKKLQKAFYYSMKGKKIINVADVIKDAGVDEKGRPKLAIIRADAKVCYAKSWNDGMLEFSLERWNQIGRFIRLPNGTVPSRIENIKAVVPSIPPRLRPAGALSKYYILWEADWEDVPVDPILLKRISGYLFVVLATWNLTELERAVLK